MRMCDYCKHEYAIFPAGIFGDDVDFDSRTIRRIVYEGFVIWLSKKYLTDDNYFIFYTAPSKVYCLFCKRYPSLYPYAVILSNTGTLLEIFTIPQRAR